MFGLGIGELLIILAALILLFNRRLPDLGGSFGAAIRKFKKALHEPAEIDITPPDESRQQRDKK
jgi:sec-independent protein translocase protein TatA